MAVITAAVVVAGAAVAGAVQAGKAAKSGKKAARARAAIAKLENARTRRNQIREERIVQGTVLARAATSGGGGGGFGGLAGSGTRGQQEGIRSQLASNIRHLNKASALNATASAQEVKAIGFQGSAAMFAGIGAAAGAVGGLFAAAPPAVT
jgi:hypothetical protein